MGRHGVTLPPYYSSPEEGRFMIAEPIHSKEYASGGSTEASCPGA